MNEFHRGLPPSLRHLAIRARLKTAEECLQSPLIDLLLPEEAEACEEIQALKLRAAKLILRKPVKASDLLKDSRRWSRLSLGSAALDNCLRGGLCTRGITELCGAAGAGKTQLLLQLSLTVQLPTSLGGFDAEAAFICTEDVFPARRLFDMIRAFESKYPSLDIGYMSRIHVEHLRHSETLLSCVNDRLPLLMSQAKIGLIVIDSVAAIFRHYTDYIERARDMRKLAQRLLSLAETHQCAVVCVNQVTSAGAEEPEVPCLGLSWAHLGRTRVRLSRLPRQIEWQQDEAAQPQLLVVRKLEIIYSPETPNDSTEFLITGQGIVGIDDVNKRNTKVA